VWRNPVQNSEDEFSKMNYSDRVVRVGDKDKLDAHATGLLATIRKFSDAKWDWILRGAMIFAESKWKGSDANKVIHPAIEIEEPFLLSDASAASDNGKCSMRVDLEDTSTQFIHRDHGKSPQARPSIGPGVTKDLQEEVGQLDMGHLPLDDAAERDE